MTDEELATLQKAALRSKKRKQTFIFCPKGEDGKPYLLITPRLTRKRLYAIKRAAQVKTFIRGKVKGDEKGRLVFDTEHAEAMLLYRKLVSPLSSKVPALKKSRVHGPNGELKPARPSRERRQPDELEAHSRERHARAEERLAARDREREARREREERHREAVAERGRRRRINGPVSLVVAPSGVITHVDIERPSFRSRTKKALRKRYPELHDDSGNLLPGHDRRHSMAWEMLDLEITQALTGITTEQATTWLSRKGITPRSDTLKGLAKAVWTHATDQFNDLDNLWVGPDDPNRNLGRLIPVLKRVMSEVRAGLDLEEHPVTRSLRSFDIPQMSKLVIDDPEVLRSWFFQALVDPELKDQGETRELLEKAEKLFQGLFPKDEYY